MSIEKHSVGCVFVRAASAKGRLEVLTVGYAILHTGCLHRFQTVRVFAGTGLPGERVNETVEREMGEEVAESATDFGFRYLFPDPVFFDIKNDDHTGAPTFAKLFFALE